MTSGAERIAHTRRPPVADSDWIGAWFPLLEERGELPYILFGKLGSDGGEPRWSLVPHERYDGIGGLAELLRRDRVDFGAIPQAAHPEVPGRLRRLRETLRFLRWSLCRSPFRAFAQARRGRPVSAAWYSFSTAETLALRAAARAEGVTLNTLLLHRLHPSIAERLLSDGRSGRWVIPVNLRGLIETSEDTGNQATNLFIDVGSATPIGALHRQVEGRLHDFTPWGALDVLRLARWIGVAMLARLVDLYTWLGVSWVGTFTNLGAWSSPVGPDGADSAAAVARLIAPPVSHWCPVGAGALTYNGRLSLLVQLHPSLSLDPEEPRRCLDGWLNGLGRPDARARLARFPPDGDGGP